jgi:hypothetical protein
MPTLRNYLQNQNKSGNNLDLSGFSGGATTTTGNECYIKAEIDVGNVLAALDSSENNEYYVPDEARIAYHRMTSDSPFYAIPFIVIMEESASFTNREDTWHEPDWLLDAAIGGVFLRTWGPMMEAKFRDSGTFEIPAFDFDITPEAQLWMENQYKKQLEENTTSDQFTMISGVLYIPWQVGHGISTYATLITRSHNERR